MLRPFELRSGTKIYLTGSSAWDFLEDSVKEKICTLLPSFFYSVCEWHGWSSKSFLGLWARKPRPRDSGVKSLKESGSYVTFGSVIPVLDCLYINEWEISSYVALNHCFSSVYYCFILIHTGLWGTSWSDPRFLSNLIFYNSPICSTPATLAHAKLSAAFSSSFHSELLSLRSPPTL